MDGNYPICFWKGKVSDFTDPDPKYRWLILKNDKAVGKVNEDHEAGMIQMKFSINAKHLNGPVEFMKPGKSHPLDVSAPKKSDALFSSAVTYPLPMKTAPPTPTSLFGIQKVLN